jgi:excisionase family DNA binding protein
MGKNITVSQEELAAIRGLSDFDLTMILSEISDHGWPAAQGLLPMISASQSGDSISTWEAARLTGLHEQTIRNYIRQNKLRYFRGVDGRYRVERAQVEQVALALSAINSAFDHQLPPPQQEPAQ